MPISKLAMKRWFSDKYLEDNPSIYEEFMNILNKSGEDHNNFIKAYDLFANYRDDEKKLKQINTKTLIITGSDDQGSTPKMSKELNNDMPNYKFINIILYRFLYISINRSSACSFILPKLSN